MQTYFLGVNGQYTVTIVSTPAGTPVSGSTNTFDYPILSSVTLTCMVTSSDGSTFTVTNYQWNTTRCYTNDPITISRCFPTGQTTQSVTGNNLLAEDAGTITCTATIGGVDYTSEPSTLRISGIVRVINNYNRRRYILIKSKYSITDSLLYKPYLLPSYVDKYSGALAA